MNFNLATPHLILLLSSECRPSFNFRLKQSLRTQNQTTNGKPKIKSIFTRIPSDTYHPILFHLQTLASDSLNHHITVFRHSQLYQLSIRFDPILLAHMGRTIHLQTKIHPRPLRIPNLLCRYSLKLNLGYASSALHSVSKTTYDTVPCKGEFFFQVFLFSELFF